MMNNAKSHPPITESESMREQQRVFDRVNKTLHLDLNRHHHHDQVTTQQKAENKAQPNQRLKLKEQMERELLPLRRRYLNYRMKDAKQWLAPLVFSFFLGCGLAVSQYFLREYSLAEPNVALAGSTMMRWEWGAKNYAYRTIVRGDRRDITFNRLTDKTVEMTYREYALGGQLDRPHLVYSEELKSDLSKSDTIVFREIRIKVDSVDTKRIVYTILQESNFIRQLSVNNPGDEENRH